MDTWFEAGHVAIVTGGSRGLGRAIARELLGHGVRTIIDGRDAGVLQAASEELSRYGELIAIAGNVADTAHVHALFDAARAFGRLDLLVNNASTLGEVPLPRVANLTPQILERVFGVNVFAPIHLMRHAARAMQRSDGVGTIVNITSDAGVEAYATWGGYGASKAALEQISRVFAQEVSETRVRVLLADPGDMDTQMHRDALPDADPAELRDPADVARALLDAIGTMTNSYQRVRLGERVRA